MKINPIHMGLMAVSSPLEVGAGQAPELLAHLKKTFEAANYPGLEIIQSNGLVDDSFSATETGRSFYNQRVDAICVIAASWFEDYLILDLLEECKVPVIAWARPGMETGSLCGVQQLGFILKQINHPYNFIFDNVNSSEAADQAWHYVQAAAICYRLRHAKIGWLGHRVEGMTDTTPHELALKKIFGPRIVGIDTQVFLDASKQVDPDSVNDQWEDLQNQVGHVLTTRTAGIEALQFDVVFRKIIREKGLSAIAVGCYPYLMGKPCLSASLLGEEGIPISCEGDVNGALAMLILTWFSNEPIHNTDLLDPIPQDNAIVFSHCGSGGFSLAVSSDDIILGPVRLMDRGVCALFPAKPGIVTLINITSLLTGYKMAVLYGEAIRTDMIFPGNPLRVRFASDYRSILDWIAKEGLGHHWMAAYGDFRQSLEYLADIVGCELTMKS